MAKLSFGQIRDEQSSVIHHEREIHFLFHLPQNISHNRIQKELPDFILDRRNGLAFEPLVVVFIFLRPKRPDERVFDLPDNLGPVVVVGEQAIHAEQSLVPTFQQRGRRIVENIFESRPPRVPPDALESRHDARGDEVPVIGGYRADDVQSDGEFQVARIEIHQMIRPLRRDVVQKFFGQVAVRVNDTNTVAQRDVLQNQIPQQGGFSSAGFADDIEVLPFVHGGNAKGLGFAPAGLLANNDVGVLMIHGAKTSRHSMNVPVVVDVVTPAAVLGARRRDNGGWF